MEVNVYKNQTCFIRLSVRYEFQLSSPRIIKFKRKEKEFLNNGTLGKIILNQDFELVDGYCSYLICKKYGMDKVPVYFVD